MSAPRGGHRNRLAHESSPYLLLHAGNPVDWHAWGEPAFEAARQGDKPVFLSVGYSTCYWCHVMERESFSDPEIARQLNAGFVSIKLDREERPDLDEIYMTATQLLTGSGGWPNSVFLTHDGKPFFAGTYFPPRDVHGRPGFPRVLASIREAWEKRRPAVLEQAEAVADAIREQMGAAAAPHAPGPEAVRAVRAALGRRFDAEQGGFGGAPKFPSPPNLYFLADRAEEGDDEARGMLVTTLDHMARGGIHDQIGGGFHRYSTDARWLVPHFEKMLYDNAALVELLAHAAPLAPGAGFARVARATADFVLAEMTGDHGGFLSAIDAETDGDEGAYYTWTAAELRAALGDEAYALAAPVYGFAGSPNFEGGRYVLHLPRPLSEAAQERGIDADELVRRLEPGRRALVAARAQRQRPLTDDKVLTDWNGLMIAALARAGVLLDEPRYGAAAARAATFVLEHARAPEGHLLHTWRGGAAKVAALLDDYAFLVRGLLALHAATGERGWLDEARRLADEQDRRLWDDAAGGYFNTGEDPQLLVRSKAAYDGAMASGNGVAALNLLELEARTGERRYRDRCLALLRAFGRGIEASALAHVTLAQAVARLGLTERPARAPSRPIDVEAEAAVSAQARLEPGEGPWRAFVLDLTIRPGWHLNANPASAPSLVATAVDAAVGRVRSVAYPEGDELRVGDADTLRVYAGHVRIAGQVEAADAPPALRLTYQACDEARCLAPVTREIPLR